MPWIKDVSIEDHHRGEYKEHFGSTDLRTMIEKSAAHMHYNKDNPQDPTPAMRFGTIFHTAVLEPEKLAVEPDVNKRTNAGKAELAAFEAENADKIICSKSELLQAQDMAHAINRHRFAAVLLDAPGHVEITGTFREPTYGIPCKIRPDKLNQEDGIIIDLKTTTDAGEEAFSKSIFTFGFDVQGCFYNLGGHQIDKKSYEFVIIAVEKTPPYGVNTFRLTEKHFEIAYQKIDGVLDQLKRCIETDKWPSYPQKIISPDIPAWEFKKYHQ
jgi:exodeoxyribonuclease VIII